MPQTAEQNNEKRLFILLVVRPSMFNWRIVGFRNLLAMYHWSPPVAYAEICKGGGFGGENVIALSSPGNGQKLPKLGLHSKIKCFGFKNIL